MVSAYVMIGLHEIFYQDLPVKGTVPANIRNHGETGYLPAVEVVVQAGKLLADRLRIAAEVYKDKSLPYSTVEFIRGAPFKFPSRLYTQ